MRAGVNSEPPLTNGSYLATKLRGWCKLCGVAEESAKVSTLGVPSTTFATIFNSSGYPRFDTFSFTGGLRRVPHAPQQRLYFRPLPQGHEALRATVATPLSCDLDLNNPSMISVSQISTATAGCENA
jgi:hypothetical protein